MPDAWLRVCVAVVLGLDWRGNRFGLTRHRAKEFPSLFSQTVEEAFCFYTGFVSNPLLCVTVTARSTAELRRQRDEVADADLVELRLDSVSDPSAAGALAGRRAPVIVTCRPAWEGGRFAGAEEDRRRILSDALALGAEYVDIEWRANFADLLSQTGGKRVVLSCHDFDGMPSDLSARAEVMRSTGAEVV